MNDSGSTTLPWESVDLRAVENAVARSAGVSRAAVLIQEDDNGNDRLVAYAVPAAGSRVPSAVRLLDQTAEVLPAYAVPDAVVFLDDLPLTTSGDVNH
jgi:acyl-CoA synthetase (AMP-forming)/AMP-acid ligase II